MKEGTEKAMGDGRGGPASGRTTMSAPGSSPTPGARRSGAHALLRRWGLLIAIAAVMTTGYALGWHKAFTLSALISHQDMLAGLIGDYRIVALFLYVVLYALAVALSFPGASLMTIAAGFLFGWLAAGLATVVAATGGAVLLFFAVRTSLGASLRRRAGPFLKQLSDGFREDAVSYLLFLRLTPVFPFWLVNIAPALFHVPLRPYVLTTFFGIIPGTFAYAVFGAGLGSVIEAQEAANPGCAAAGTCSIDVAAIVTPQLLVALFALGLVALLPVALKTWRRRHHPAATPNGE